VEIEWEDNPGKRNQPDDQFRCISDGVGGSKFPRNDGRGVVSLGNISSHQLPLTTGCHLSSQIIICKKEILDINPVRFKPNKPA